MPKRTDDRFRPRLAPPRAGGRGEPQRFVSRVMREASKAGRSIGNRVPRASGRVGVKRGRGYVAAKFAGDSLGPRSRRVIVKMRMPLLKGAGFQSTRDHFAYVARDEVDHDGGPGQLYGATTDDVDRRAFAERSANDRHQFRFMISPEDAAQIGDLKTFTREFMAQMERDLGTRLDWVAGDHWNTDNPHTHVVLRGKDETGADLVISRDYIVHAMRQRACGLATEWLGRRTELEIRQSLQREVNQERWTSLDRALKTQEQDGIVELRRAPADAYGRFYRAQLTGRLDQLSDMGLAHKVGPNSWRLEPRAEHVLRAMGERGDIIRTMQRAMGDAKREYSIIEPGSVPTPVVGRIAAKGVDHELHERGHLIIDGIDGRTHYAALSPSARLADYSVGAIVQVRSGAEPRPADRTVASLAKDGIYRTAKHLEVARFSGGPGRDPTAFVEAHVRRLEALRRAGIVERISDGVWKIPASLSEKGQAYDAMRVKGPVVEIQSHLPIEKQTRAIGATWLDRQLVTGAQSVSAVGFGVDVRAALAARASFLLESGFAVQHKQRVVVMRNLLATLRSREVELTAKVLEVETGHMHRSVNNGVSVSGIYKRSLMLVSGRYAMIEDGLGFALVPWRPVIEQRIGQAMTAVVNGDYVSWSFGRTRKVSL
jgi:type IV secretory pathway VirD2 relaxase